MYNNINISIIEEYRFHDGSSADIQKRNITNSVTSFRYKLSKLII